MTRSRGAASEDPLTAQAMQGRPARVRGPRLLLLGYETARNAEPDPAGLVIANLGRCKWTPHNMDVDCLVLPLEPAPAAVRLSARLATGVGGVLLARLSPETSDIGFGCRGDETGGLAVAVMAAVCEEGLACSERRAPPLWARAIMDLEAVASPALPVGWLCLPQASEFGGQLQMRRLQQALQASTTAYISWMMRAGFEDPKPRVLEAVAG